MRKPTLCLISRMLLPTLAVALSPLAAYAKGSSKDLSIQVVETTEERFVWKNPPTATYHAKVILPDGAHANLVCDLFDNSCGSIEPWTPPERTAPADCQSFVSDPPSATSYVSCTRKNLGTYRAKRKGDDLAIYGRKGKVTYHISTGPW
jgi:hypothetical protein